MQNVTNEAAWAGAQPRLDAVRIFVAPAEDLRRARHGPFLTLERPRRRAARDAPTDLVRNRIGEGNTMQTRKMNLVALVIAGPTVHHHGAWRHPESDTDLLDPKWYEHLGRVLEEGKFDAIFFADFFAFFSSVVGQNRYETILNRGGQLYMLDPLLLLAMVSRVTRHLGLGATMSTTLFKPSRSRGRWDR